MRTLSSLIRRDVVTQSGTKLGRCYDLRGELTTTTLRVSALCVGRYGVLQRLGIPIKPKLAVIQWEAVSAIERDRIIVRDDLINIARDERRAGLSPHSSEHRRA